MHIVKQCVGAQKRDRDHYDHEKDEQDRYLTTLSNLAIMHTFFMLSSFNGVQRVLEARVFAQNLSRHLFDFLFSFQLFSIFVHFFVSILLNLRLSAFQCSDLFLDLLCLL